MKRLVFTLGLASVFLLGAWTIKNSVAQSSMHSMSHKMSGMTHAKMSMMPVENKKKVEQTLSLIQSIKMKDMKNGTYNCCLKHSCIDCAATMGACDCGKKLLAGKPVCNECKGGWYAGDGKFSGIKPSQVKTLPRGMMGHMHNMKGMHGMHGMHGMGKM